MNKSVNRFITTGRILWLSILFALVMNVLSGWMVQRLKEEYRLAKVSVNNTEILDENKYYHYLKYFGTMDIRYKSDKALRYDSKDEEVEFYRISQDAWESGLDALVSDISQRMPIEEAEKFSSSQKLWSESKDKLAEVASSSIKDSRDKNIQYMESRIDSVRARAYELLKNYKHILENSYTDTE